MVMSFSFFSVKQFPPSTHEGELVLAAGGATLGGMPADTKVIFKGKTESGGFEHYHVYHEYLRHTAGRTFKGLDFTEFYEKHDFNAFYDREKSLLICQFSKAIARDFVDTLNEARSSSFNADYMALNFEVIKPRMKEIRGIWFADMAEANLVSAGIFGPNVDQSELYKHVSARGKASSFLVNYTVGEHSYPMIISLSYNITLLRSEGEELSFSLIKHVQENLLAGAIITQPSRYNAKEKRRMDAEDRRKNKRSKLPPGAVPLPFNPVDDTRDENEPRDES